MMKIIFEKERQTDPEWLDRGAVTNELDGFIHQPLRQVDIVSAIRYYGITELLDNIGIAQIECYLATNG